MNDTAVMIMAGGRGSRLGPLTVHRSKPAVPFAGRYRIIDFVLSNFVNSGYRRIYVLTQYMASSLIRHLNRAWRLHGFGEFVEVVPAQMRMGEFWYRGTADAVYQNLNLIHDESAPHTAVFGGDLIPRLVREGARALIYDFAQNPIPGEPEDHIPYWRDVGTIDSYFDSNMELRSAVPPLNLYNRNWRIHTAQRDYPPVRLLRHFPDGGE